MITQIHSIAIFVADREVARKFFQQALYFEVTADVTDPANSENRWLTIKPKSSETNLMILQNPERATATPRSNGLTLVSDSIFADCDRIKLNGGNVLYPPKRAGWGNALETHFSDPDGNIFMLIEKTEP